jgi:hypothetical protein
VFDIIGLFPRRVRVALVAALHPHLARCGSRETEEEGLDAFAGRQPGEVRGLRLDDFAPRGVALGVEIARGLRGARHRTVDEAVERLVVARLEPGAEGPFVEEFQRRILALARRVLEREPVGRRRQP